MAEQSTAQICETQSDGELLALCEPSTETMQADGGVDKEGKNRDKGDSPQAEKKTGRAKRKEKRLKNEPQNTTGEGGPCGVHVLDFVEARATEVSSMSKALACKGGSKLTAQKLPRHMRRRAASHNVKRLPRRCREAAAKEMEKSNALSSGFDKKRSRKHRRNTRNLQSQYAQRQREYKWLETHLWHAKRMKMCKEYGYCLSEHCADKGVRAAYMSLTHGCLISDISYYGCVQVTGVQGHVIKCLAPLFSSEAGLTIAGNAFLTGAREGKAMLYRSGGYPLGALGPVQFLWKTLPLTGVGTADATPTSLWVWFHPAMYTDVLSEINACVRMWQEGQQEGVESQISVRDINSELVRFRLLGPRSHALLMEALKPVFGTESDQEDRATQLDSMEVDPPAIPDVPRWWRFSSEGDLEQHCHLLSEAYDSIKSASTPAQIQKGSVLGMIVSDPRLSTPSHKLDMVSQFYPLRKNTQGSVVKEKRAAATSSSLCGKDAGEAHLSPMPTLSSGLAYSPLWNSYTRSVVSDSKPETHVINTLHSRQLVPSSTLDLGSKMPRVPVLLIQQILGPRRASSRSLSKDEATAYGWDLVVPANWGKEFWVSLIYHGARVCGLKELHKCSQEVQAQHFPDDFPDTPSGQAHYEKENERLVRKYTLSPPDKRRNYGKFLVASPFEYPWRELVSSWSQESRIDCFIVSSQSTSKRIKLKDQELSDNDVVSEGGTASKRALEYKEDSDICTSIDPLMSSFYVLRETDALTALNQFVERLFSRKQLKCGQDTLQYVFKVTLQEFSIDEYLLKHRSALIGVRVQTYERGSLSSHNVISIPCVSDFAPLLSPRHIRSHSGPKQDLHPKGMTVVEGNSLTIGVSSLYKSQIMEVKEKRKVLGKQLKKVKQKEGEESTMVASSFLPAAAEDFKLHPIRPSRETFGYITSAGYRLTTSQYSGVGFCTFAGYLEALYRSYMAGGVREPLALVRGADTQYWFVRLGLS